MYGVWSGLSERDALMTGSVSERIFISASQLTRYIDPALKQQWIKTIIAFTMMIPLILLCFTGLWKSRYPLQRETKKRTRPVGGSGQQSFCTWGWLLSDMPRITAIFANIFRMVYERSSPTWCYVETLTIFLFRYGIFWQGGPTSRAALHSGASI